MAAGEEKVNFYDLQQSISSFAAENVIIDKQLRSNRAKQTQQKDKLDWQRSMQKEGAYRTPLQSIRSSNGKRRREK